MHRMHARTRVTIAVIAATIVASACSNNGANADKAGGLGEPVVLRMANTYGDLGDLPAVAHFVDRVGELSGGEVRIEVVDRWGEFAPDAEQQVVGAVSDGEVDLGWVGTRAFDTLGVESFRALTAPLLVDSYALEDAIIESGITEQMMRALNDVGVAGLAVLADGLRKPIGVAGPVIDGDDWQGLTFGTLRSNDQAAAIRALGAIPAQVFGEGRMEALDKGKIQGFEYNLYLYARDPGLQHLAPYVTSNVNLWPQMDVLIANPARLAALTAEQRAWLEEAARDAAARSAALADEDADAVSNACATGARFAEASTGDLAALAAAFAPVYANLQQDPETNAFIERIQTLKRSIPAGPSLSIPSHCTGKAPEQVSEDATGGTGSAPAFLNGTYRWVLTQADADKVGDTDTGYPHVDTIMLKDGHLEGGCFGADGGTYSVDENRITFHSIEYGYDSTVTFSVDDQGNLHLKPVPPIDPGDAFECFYKPWTKID